MRGLPWEPMPGKSSTRIPVNIDVPETEGESKEYEFGNRITEKRRPMNRREDVEKMGATAGRPACHKQMRGEVRVGTLHAEECQRKHEANMSREEAPRFQKAFDNLMQEGEETMRRNNANRQANEERER